MPRFKNAMTNTALCCNIILINIILNQSVIFGSPYENTEQNKGHNNVCVAWTFIGNELNEPYSNSNNGQTNANNHTNAALIIKN